MDVRFASQPSVHSLTRLRDCAFRCTMPANFDPPTKITGLSFALKRGQDSRGSIHWCSSFPTKYDNF